MRKYKNLNFKKYLIAASPILIILVIVAGFWGYENYQGARHLNEVQELIAKEGAAVELDDLNIELPDPSENFATSKYISASLDFEIDGTHNRPADRDRFLNAIEMPTDLKVPLWETGRVFVIDTENNSLKKLKSIIEKDFEVIREIDSKVDCQTAAYNQPINEENPFATLFPHLNDFRKFTKFNLLRALVAIEETDRETAITCLKTNQQLINLFDSSPTQIALLLKIIVIRHSETIIWHGMMTESWQASDYQLFINLLKNEEHRIPNLLKQVNGDMILNRVAMEALAKKRFRDQREFFNSFGTEIGILSFVPKGTWLHNSAYSQTEIIKGLYIPIRDMNFTLHPPTSPLASTGINKLRTTLANLVTISTSRTLQYVARSLVYEKLTRTACAIHLHQMETGELPNSLNELAPKYIENVDDIMNPGNPLVYRIDSKDKQHWTLYSIGTNGTDDGGKVEWKKLDKRDYSKGDLVWSVPAIQHPSLKPAQ